MAGVVFMVGKILPPMPAPARLGLLVTVGGIAFLAALTLCARGTLMELIGLVVRRSAPVQAAT
jgi:hypothetical protein